MSNNDANDIYYSVRYTDETEPYQYRYVVLPPALQRALPRRTLMSEDEWRALGLVMRPGWQHVGWYRGKTTMLFRRRSQAS